MSNTFETILDALKGETVLVQPRVSREVRLLLYFFFTSSLTSFLTSFCFKSLLFYYFRLLFMF